MTLAVFALYAFLFISNCNHIVVREIKIKTDYYGRGILGQLCHKKVTESRQKIK